MYFFVVSFLAVWIFVLRQPKQKKKKVDKTTKSKESKPSKSKSASSGDETMIEVSSVTEYQ